jgi:kynureninase
MIKNEEMTQFMDDVAALVYLKRVNYKSDNLKSLECEIRERLEDHGCRVVVKLLAERKYRKLTSELALMETVYPDLKGE